VRAFLSHSSKDKAFVRSVASELGDAQSEYDERTFEYTLSVSAIRSALERSDVFVYFLSAESIKSSFVAEELRGALEKRGAGLLKRVLVVTLDGTSYRALPEWLREINVVQKLSSPKACARKIQAALVQLEAEQDSGAEIYLGREQEDAALAKALSVEPAKSPIALHAVGHFGVGRKTYLRKNLHALFPRRFDTFPEIATSSGQGIEELYRQIYDLYENRSLEDTLSDFAKFANLTAEEQIKSVSSIIDNFSGDGELLLIIDDGGVYTEEGDFQPHIAAILASLRRTGLPAIGFIQTRMMPARLKLKHQSSFHQYIQTLSDDNARRLLGLTLKQLEVNYTDEQIGDASKIMDGHPFNIKFAAVFAYQYGLDILLADPSDLIDWKRRRAEDFLKRMDFNEIECDVIAVLSEYRYAAAETIFAVLNYELPEIAGALRRLQEFSCVERREDYNHIAPPLRDGVRRDDRFARSNEWKQRIGKAICDSISEYKDGDDVPVAILDSGALAAARGATAPPFLANLILPSHLLRIVRDHYDAGRRGQCIEFCERAWAAKTRLPPEAQLEVLRLWGLSAVRVADEDAFNGVMASLKAANGRTAERIALFLEGFSYRVHKRADEAERKFLAAWRLAPDNQSINRELASLLAKQRRYDEAERFARRAYDQAPTNPYLIDVMAEVLLGKAQQGLHVDKKELDRIMGDLERYGDVPGSSFFLVRKAHAELANNNYRAALTTADKAVVRTPGLLNAYFIRAEAKIALRDPDGASGDVTEIQRLLTQAGGFSEGDEARLQELEVRILVEKGLLRQAKEIVDRSAWLSRRVSHRLFDLIARATNFSPSRADEELRRWAEKRLNPKGDS
jgi:tetratricopeptide (TPR) repeat protein